ncbi:MAG: class I tRNA ligase family protein, partial [Planctomycetota bacterium]
MVHLAPAFGEDDYRVAKEAGLGFLLLVDVAGKMTEDCPEVAGLFCKDADRQIIRMLKAQGSLVREEQYKHEYPFCWRASDDPLIQYARPAWFVGTSRFKDSLLENNQAIRWVPEHIKEGRFGKFLENNVDWALSRERFWGTPLPVWRCESTGHLDAIGCYDELTQKPGVEGLEVWTDAKAKEPELSDHLKVHRPYIDAVTYQSPKDPSARMRRVVEVIDCWYDSGAMPFAQWGYPWAEGSEEKFKQAFPADFICEAIDQTRGWFYSLLAESTLIQQGQEKPHPYRTCIVLGHVCDDKGVKMSKSLGNYVSPNEAMDAHGADALRWYFLSQGHPWTNARFSLTRVGEAKKDFLIRLQNVYGFFLIYANIDGFDPTKGAAGFGAADPFAGAEGFKARSERGLMDRWILSELHLCARTVNDALENYEILGAANGLFDFVDQLSNWYVRRSRARFWGSGLTEDKYDAYWTLYECLVSLSKLCAPFVPFFSESIYQNLVSKRFDAAPESVHLCDYPEPDANEIDETLSRRMGVVRTLVALGRGARVEAKMKVRQPLRQATLCLADDAAAAEIKDLLDLVEGELNVNEVKFATDAAQFVDYVLKPNFRKIGPRLGKKIQSLKAVLKDADAGALRASLDANGYCEVEVDGEAIRLSPEEIEVSIEPKEGFAAKSEGGMVLILDTTLDDELRAQWKARELVACVNSLRGERGLEYEARIDLKVSCAEDLKPDLEANIDYVKGETLSDTVMFVATGDAPEGAKEGSAGDQSFWVTF